MSEQARVIARVENSIGWIVFSNVARHNAVTFEMWSELPRLLREHDQNPAVRVIVLTGDGDKAFVAGADISQFEQKRGSAEASAAYNEAVDFASSTLVECSKPTIAKIRGICVGGGLALALNCDLRFCSDNALFRMPAARLGLGYGFAGVKRMVDVLGPANASDLFFSARKFGAADALQIGFANRVFALDQLDQGVADYCALIAQNAPLTVAAAKASIRAASRDRAERDMSQVNAAIERCFTSEDYIEGRRAFMEKREAQFRGR